MDFGSGLWPTFFIPIVTGSKNSGSGTQEIVTQVEELLQPLLADHGLNLIEVEFAKRGRKAVLRLFIDKAGGVSLDDCAAISQWVGEVLDVHDLIPYSYILEVSSPGLTRVLKRTEEYQYFTGRLVRITVRAAAGQRTAYRGKLLGLEGEEVLVAEGEQVHRIPLRHIVQARLDIDF